MANKGVVESIKSWKRRDERARARMQRITASHTGECRNVGKDRDGKPEKADKLAEDGPTQHPKPRNGYSLCDGCLSHRQATAKKTPPRLRPRRKKKKAAEQAAALAAAKSVGVTTKVVPPKT